MCGDGRSCAVLVRFSCSDGCLVVRSSNVYINWDPTIRLTMISWILVWRGAAMVIYVLR